ncbi:hypothetical protein [Ardenticatena maritima]|uniref:Uncharacterized protein n=1 Tax=Ardenticatena maritima TaxID=872965 RepID=A0A0N8GSH0_9CHLR|nr:hypothetical protein [Ardenticatena maritima]KPL89274.1 hypothetical protein SE16_02015 [Ardenticatena maritima]
MRVKPYIGAIVFLLLFTTACGLMEREKTKPLLPNFTMERIKDGYSLALSEAREWSHKAYLESVDAIYRRDREEWKISKASYTFVDKDTKTYIVIEINKAEGELLITPPGRIGVSTSIVTTSQFYLERNKDETEALYKSIAILGDMTEKCGIEKVIIAGAPYAYQGWDVRFVNPRWITLSPLFLAEIYVNAETGDIVRRDLSNLWKICNTK